LPAATAGEAARARSRRRTDARNPALRIMRTPFETIAGIVPPWDGRIASALYCAATWSASGTTTRSPLDVAIVFELEGSAVQEMTGEILGQGLLGNEDERRGN
jgi:hypothetical protein